MKKRIISLLLAVCMCAQMLPVAFAEDIAVSDSNNSVQEEQSETETPDNQTAPAGGDPAQMAEPQEQAESEEKSQSIEQMESTTAPTPTATPTTEAGPTPEATSAPEAEVDGTLPAATATPTTASAVMQAAMLTEDPAEGTTVIGSGGCGENLTWTEYSDGTLVIEGFGAMADYIDQTSNSPWSLDIKAVWISDGVTSIGNLAFARCANLESVRLPDGLTRIGASAFSECTNLTDITLPDRVTSIEAAAFYKCSNLKNLNIPAGVVTIGQGAFYGCANLTEINLPEGLTKIEKQTFSGCSNLIRVSIPEGITSIGEEAFHDCNNLESLLLPDSLISIGEDAFDGCSKLANVQLPSKLTSLGTRAFAGCESLKSINIPQGVDNIGDGTFNSCSNLSDITLPDSVVSIGDNAFYGCLNLTNITLPDSIESIGHSAFLNCKKISEIIIPDGVDVINTSTFSGCQGLKSVTIPISVTEIGDNAFNVCDQLTDVYFAGTEADWDNIYIGRYNTDLLNATIHFNSSVTDPKGFWPQRDGWCINNTFAPLGLDEEYSSEWLQYYDIVCSIHPLKWFEKAFGQFQGYCFGYSLLAAAQYENKIDLQEYFPNNGGDTLNTFGWQTIESLEDGTQYYSLVGNAKAIDVIERAHYMQVASGISGGEIGKGDTDYTDVLAYLQKENSLPLLVCVNDRKNNFSHAMLTDTTVKPVEAYPGWYVIYCYDPNAPQYTNELENSAYSLPESYIWICPGTGEWQYFCNDTCTAEDEYYSTADIFALTTPTIRFYDISDFTKSYFTDKLALQDDNPKSIYVGGVSIYDHAKNLIFSVLDGMQDARGDWRPFCEDEDTSSNVSKGTVLYPENAKIIESTGDAGVLNVWNDALIAYTADGDVSVEINEDNTAATITNAGSKTVTFSLALGNQTEAASTSAAGTLEAGKKLTMTLIGEEVTAVTDSDETKITTELYLDGDDTVDESQFHISVHTITVSAGENGTITPSDSVLVADGGSQTFNIIANNGYVIADVKIDGASVGAVSQYTFNDVKTDHTIYASFEPKQEQGEHKIESFTVTGTPSKTTYNLGEAFDATGLTLTVTYDDGTVETVTSGYDVTPAVMEADTTQVVLSYGGVEAKPITGLTVRENLVSIQAPQAITGLPNGTEKTAKALGLPGTVKITTSRTQQPTTEATVTWDVENCTYDPNSKSAQTFTVQGTVVLPDGMTNLQNVPLTIGVSVKVKANDDTPENPDYPSDSENPTTSGNTESNGVSSLSTVTSEAQSASDDAGQTNDAQITIVPQTSDTLPVTGLIVLMAVSFVAVLALMVKRKKKQ